MPTASASRVVAYYPPLPPGERERFTALTRNTQAFAHAHGLVVVEPFVESRRGRRRPDLERALARCRDTRSALLVPQLVAVGGDLAFLDPVATAGVTLVAADVGRVSRPTLRLLAEVARHAQNEASARSRAALRAARDRGVALGSPRPEIGSRAGVAALRARADAQARETAPILAELILGNPGASLRDIAQLLDALGVPTPRRGRWGPSAVRNAIRRAGLETLRESTGERR